MDTKLNVGIYCRLSKEDEKSTNKPSDSIQNQLEIIRKYARDNSLFVVNEYIDDGCSGTNFNRDRFKRMIEDIERGAINCIITKDLSRLGRNYAMAGYYTEDFFPRHGVRYIALNDNFDSCDNDYDLIAFKNVMNEFYPKEVSKKVRQVKQQKIQDGKFIGSFAPFGYAKDAKDHNHLVINETTSKVIQYIYSEIINGISARQISINLNDSNILSPSQEIAKMKGKEIPNTQWGSATILSIIRSAVYIGHMVQGKRKVTSYKVHKRVSIDKSEWVTVKDTHEPIVTNAIWNDAQTVVDSKGKYRQPRTNRNASIFSGLLKCSDCNSNLVASMRGRKGSEQLSYRCSAYVNKGKSFCSSHNIRENALVEIVSNDICRFKLLQDSVMINYLSKRLKNLKSSFESEIHIAEQQMNNLTSTIKSLYADRNAGKLPDTVFFALLPDYTKELETYSFKIKNAQKNFNDAAYERDTVNAWATKMRKSNPFEINREVILGLIDYITVSDNINDPQRISIYYKVVGNISELLEQQNIIENNMECI